MYMAFGVKAGEVNKWKESCLTFSPIRRRQEVLQLVTWWSAGSTLPQARFKRHLNISVSPESFFQGGLDDYFLSGSQTCSDGAESCPDTTKVTKLCD